jgi:hypothetical protein
MTRMLMLFTCTDTHDPAAAEVSISCGRCGGPQHAHCGRSVTVAAAAAAAAAVDDADDDVAVADDDADDDDDDEDEHAMFPFQFNSNPPPPPLPPLRVLSRHPFLRSPTRCRVYAVQRGTRLQPTPFPHCFYVPSSPCIIAPALTSMLAQPPQP